jgi:gliding motility-associated-like protein
MTKKVICILLAASISCFTGKGQITAPNATFSFKTNYLEAPGTDDVFVFCTTPSINTATLTASSSLSGTLNFEWQKFNPQTLSFDLYQSGNIQSISNLVDGGYKVIITNGSNTEEYLAWVVNNWNEYTASIEESDCMHLLLKGAVVQSASNLAYYDPVSGQKIDIEKTLDVSWRAKGEDIGSQLEQEVYDPPALDTEYLLEVNDGLGCVARASVTYYSIVPEAAFSAEPMQGEAPLEVTFTNESVNVDADGYEWIFFRNQDEIDKEREEENALVDSIDFIAYETGTDFTYTYEKPGRYMVMLRTTKTSEHFVCKDSVFLQGYIVVDPSLVEAPNVFTPNGDGMNDVFLVKTQSLESLSIKIFNRWGKKIFKWEASNIQSSDFTYEHLVWDGTIGGSKASPGVYFYVIDARGRDGQDHQKNGFVHLLRDK